MKTRYFAVKVGDTFIPTRRKDLKDDMITMALSEKEEADDIYERCGDGTTYDLYQVTFKKLYRAKVKFGTTITKVSKK